MGRIGKGTMISEQTRARIAEARDSFPERRSAILPSLHAVQEDAGHLSEEAIDVIAEILDLHPNDIFQVASFYSLIHTDKWGKFLVEVCVNLPCALRGADQLSEYVQQELGLEHEGTTKDGVFTYRPTIECLAACSWAPMMQVNQRYFENLTKEKVATLLEELRRLAARYPDRPVPGTEIGALSFATERTQQ
ncbi:MAG: NADH-quinone oxidoreductase subunit NuoE [Chloroflexi bacterium]|nr:NADH-quinone oxidoreductase subunit NuoE [Chloroflexota bacterium]